MKMKLYISIIFMATYGPGITCLIHTGRLHTGGAITPGIVGGGGVIMIHGCGTLGGMDMGMGITDTGVVGTTVLDTGTIMIRTGRTGMVIILPIHISAVVLIVMMLYPGVVSGLEKAEYLLATGGLWILVLGQP
jgi:hypothetical protein